MKRKVGRPTKKTEDRATIILRALENGVTRRAAAAIAGMTEPTFYEWVAQDAAFASSVEQAQAKFMASAARKIGGHAPSLLKWTMMLARNDEQLRPVQERVEVSHGETLEFVLIDAELGEAAPEDGVQPPQDPEGSTG